MPEPAIETEPDLILDDFLPYRLSYTTNLVSEFIARAYKTLFGLTIPEWRVIAHVEQGDGITQQQICARTRMEKVPVSRATIALVERGLLDRAPKDSDRRSHRLILSAQGRALYAQVAPKALELERRIFGRIGEADRAALHRILLDVDAAALAVTHAGPGEG